MSPYQPPHDPPMQSLKPMLARCTRCGRLAQRAEMEAYKAHPKAKTLHRCWVCPTVVRGPR